MQRESRLVYEARVHMEPKENMVFGDTVHIGSITNLSTRSKSINTAITFETQPRPTPTC